MRLLWLLLLFYFKYNSHTRIIRRPSDDKRKKIFFNFKYVREVLVMVTLFPKYVRIRTL